MDNIPLSYSNHLILLTLQSSSHGYEIMKKIFDQTNGTLTVGPATMYRSLSFFLEKEYIKLVNDDENKKQYLLTQKGTALLQQQNDFIRTIYLLSFNNEEVQ